MLGISEVLFLCGTGMVIIGPRGFPRFAYEAGRTIGHCARILKRTNLAISSFSQQHQLGDIHKQLREGLDDVNAIREEWLRLTNRQAIQSALLGHHRNDSSHQGSKQSETEATLSPPKQDIDAKDSQISYLNTARTTTTHPSESLVTVSARTVRSQQQAVAGSDYLNVAIASQRLGRARQHPHQS